MIDLQSRTCLVIGAAGFIGTNLVPLLQAENWTVRTLDKTQHHFEGAETFIGDVREPNSLKEAFRNCDLVINLAAEHRDDVKPISLYDEVNVDGARNVCCVANEMGVRRQIFTSSVAVYGSHSGPMSEHSEHAYFNDYGRTKHLAELEYRAWLASNELNRLAIVRPTVVFGPGNKGNVYNLLNQIKHGPFVMIGRGHNKKSMACVGNVARFIVHLASTNFDDVVSNYADKPDFSMQELVDFAYVSLQRSNKHPNLPALAGLLCGYLADLVSVVSRRSLPISAVRVRKFMMNSEVDASQVEALGFKPEIDMKDALREMLVAHV